MKTIAKALQEIDPQIGGELLRRPGALRAIRMSGRAVVLTHYGKPWARLEPLPAKQEDGSDR